MSTVQNIRLPLVYTVAAKILLDIFGLLAPPFKMDEPHCITYQNIKPSAPANK